MQPTLRPTQVAAASAVAWENKLLLADVGAGKTATVLTAIARRRLVTQARTLVVSTVRICNLVWPDEVATWGRGLTYASAAGLSPKKRIKALDSNADIVGINFENLIWLCRVYGSILPQKFPWLVIDESSKLENPDTEGFKALAPLLPLFEWRMPMTGTPRANHLYDLWGQCYLADLGATFGQYREAFLQKWFYPQKRTFGFEWLPLPGAEEEINAKLRRVAHRMPAPEKPETVVQDIRIPLHPYVKQWRDEMREQIVVGAVDEVVIGGVTLTSKCKPRLGKMLQLSGGFIYTDERETMHLHNAKLDALDEIVQAARGEPMMVIYQFQHERDAIARKYPYARILSDDPGALDEWNAGRLPMLLAHPLSCGYGLNAQFGGSLQVWYTPTTDAELYTQTIGRIARSGQEASLVRILRLVMEGTDDRRCYMVAEAKARGEKATLDSLEEEP